MSDEQKETLTSADTSKAEEKDDDDEANGEDMEQDETETSQDKSADKSEEEEDDKGEEEEEDEESDDEPQVGLLEKPLVIEDGKKRERKKVDRISFQPDEKAHEGFKIKEGMGRSLGDIPYIEHKLSRTKAEDAKPLHRLLFRRVGSQNEVKKNIRQFSGFPFLKDDTEYEKRVQMMKGKSFTTALLKHIMDILDIPRGGNKDELITRLMDWLEKPKDSGRKIPQPKRKRKSKGGSDKKAKVKIVKKRERKKKLTKTKETAEDDDDDDDEDDEVSERGDADADNNSDDDEAENKTGDSDDAESDGSDSSEDEEEEPPKKKAKRATPKQTKNKKAKPTPKAKAPKATPKKRATPKKKKASSEEVSDVSSESDNEPLITKQKSKGPPTNDELKEVIKKMLDSANLEQVTMKTVLKDIFAKYPSFDLTDRKDFIKSTVKQIIS